MSRDEIQRLISRQRFGSLGLAKEGRAYVIPIFYGYDGRTMYFHTRRGEKTDYIESTEEACFLVTYAPTTETWASAMVFGTMGEVEDESERLAAMDALMSIPLPPEWGFAETGEPKRGTKGTTIYKLTPREISGRKSVPPPRLGEAELSAAGM